MKKIKIDMADDHTVVLAGLENIIRSFPNMEIGNVYNCGRALLEGMKTKQPDVLLLDIQMPEMGGEELAGLITETYPSVKILVMTGFDTTYFVKSMMQKGAAGYLLKNTSEVVLKKAIEAVYNGCEFIDPAIQQKLLQETLHPERQIGGKPKLTRREKDVLRLIMQEKTSQQVAETLHLSVRTVENQRVNLMQKLDVKNAVGLVKKTIEWQLLDE